MYYLNKNMKIFISVNITNILESVVGVILPI